MDKGEEGGSADEMNEINTEYKRWRQMWRKHGKDVLNQTRDQAKTFRKNKDDLEFSDLLTYEQQSKEIFEVLNIDENGAEVKPTNP